MGDDPTNAAGDEELTAEGNLGRLTDQEWRDAHERLIASGALPASELEYVWAPGQAP